MRYLIVTFLTKTEVFSFLDYLAEAGVPATTAATPKEAGIGCGLAAKVDARFLREVDSVLKKGRFGGYRGSYLVHKEGARVSKTRISL